MADTATPGGTVVGCAGLINRGHGLKHQPSTGGKETLLCTNEGGGRADTARKRAKQHGERNAATGRHRMQTNARHGYP